MGDIKKTVLDNIDKDKVVETLVDLVSIPSYADFTLPTYEWDSAKTTYMDNKAKEIGLESVVAGEISYGRKNLIQFLRGKERTVKLAIHSHIDTHPPVDYRLFLKPGNVPRNATAGLVKDGKVWGLGAGDSMPGIAAFLAAAEAIKKSNIQLKYDCFGVFDLEEMESGRGAQICVDWLKANNIKPEFMIVAEPNGYDISIAQNDLIGFEVVIHGVPGFAPSGSSREEVIGFCNTMERLVEVAQDLQSMVSEDSRFRFKHHLPTADAPPHYMAPLFWLGSSFAGAIHPGIGHPLAPCEPLKPGQLGRHRANSRTTYGPHIVPELAKLRFEFCIPPRDIKPDEVFHTEPCISRQELEELITKRLEKLWIEKPSLGTYEFHCIRQWGNPYEISPEEPHVKLLQETVKEGTGREPKLVAATHVCSEGVIFTDEMGVPFANFATPRDKYHRPDEHCEVSALIDLARVYALAMLNYCEVA